MENICTRAVIIAPPGLFRDSLKVVMEASRKISVVGIGDDWTTGQQMIAELSPKLVVIDTFGLEDKSWWQNLHQMNSEQPHIQYCILVHTREEAELAKCAEVKVVLHAGFTTQAFFDAVTEPAEISADDQSPATQVEQVTLEHKSI